MTGPTGNPAIDDLWLQDLEQEAQAAEAFSVRINYGKLTVKPSRHTHWQDINGVRTPVEVTVEQFRQLSTRDRTLELEFSVDIKEFNPTLEFEYTRRVNVSGGNTDWNKIVQPSLAKLLDKNTMKSYVKVMNTINGKYVEVQDVPQIKGEDFNTIKFLRIFPDRGECFKAWGERFGKDATSAPAPSGTAAQHAQEEHPDYPASVYGDYTSWKDTVPSVKIQLEKGVTPAQAAIDYGVDIKYIINVQNGLYD